MKKKDIVNNVRAIIRETKTLNGHFNSEVFDLGNRKYGVDIFTVSIRGSKDNRFLYLNGIYKVGVKNLLESRGVFYKEVYNSYIMIHKEDNIISEVPMKVVKDLINEYLHQLPELKLDIKGVFEVFSSESQVEAFYRQMNLVLNEGFLELLKNDTSPILCDMEEKSFLCFKDGVYKISGNSIVKKSYLELEDTVVWRDRIIDFELGERSGESSHFEKFVKNVCSNDSERIGALESAIGYLLHAHHKKSGGQMVLLYDEQITDLNNPQGGTGKGVVASAIMQVRRTVKIDGKKIKGDDRFDFQDVRIDTEVLWVDDVGKQLSIDRFNSLSTDGFNIEQKYKDSIMIPATESPKIILCSNIIMDCSGTTRKRRQFIVELSSYYSSKIKDGTEEPIIEEHGGRFFTKEWDEQEWNLFYWYMIDCLKVYLQNGLAAVPSINVFENRSRQLIGEDLHYWIQNKAFDLDQDYPTRELFEEFKSLFEEGNDRFTQRTFSNKLKQYYSLKGMKIKSSSRSVDGKKVSFFRISN